MEEEFLWQHLPSKNAEIKDRFCNSNKNTTCSEGPRRAPKIHLNLEFQMSMNNLPLKIKITENNFFSFEFEQQKTSVETEVFWQ